MKQLKAAELERLERQASAIHGEIEVLRKQTEDIDIAAKDSREMKRIKDSQKRIKDSQVSQLQASVDHARMKLLRTQIKEIDLMVKNLRKQKEIEHSQETQLRASANQAEAALRKQIENSMLKDPLGKPGNEKSQKTRIPRSDPVDDPSHTKGCQKSEALVDDPAGSSTPEVRPESHSISPSWLSRCTHKFQATCSKCQASLKPLKSRSSIASAPKTDDPVQASVESLSSGTSALSDSEQPDRSMVNPQASVRTPPQASTLEMGEAGLDSPPAGEITRRGMPEPVHSTKAADNEHQDQHKGRHPDVVHKDEQIMHAATNDGDSLHQGEDGQLQKSHVPAIPSWNSSDSNGSTRSVVPPSARWTKISKDLVDTTVLDDADERYEEKTDEVVVFRLLTKEEIDHYTFQTHEGRKGKAGLLKEAASHGSSDRDLKDLVPVSNEAALTSANDNMEPAGHLGSSKQDDRNQMEENVMTENATRVTENGGKGNQSVTDLLRVNQEQTHTIKTRFAKTDIKIRRDSNRSFPIFAAFTAICLPLIFAVIIIIDLPPSLFSSRPSMSLYAKSVIQVNQSTVFPWWYMILCNATIKYAIGACVVPIWGLNLYLYRNNFNRRSHQRWYRPQEVLSQYGRFGFTNASIWTLFILQHMINTTEFMMRIMAKSAALYTLWNSSCCLVACVLVYLMIPETGSRTLGELDRTIFRPEVDRDVFELKAAKTNFIELDCIKGEDLSFILAQESAFSTQKATRMIWMIRKMRMILQPIFLSAKEQLSFFRQDYLTFVSLPGRVPAAARKKERVDSQCRCGYRFCDDFVELRPSAAVEYGKLLRRRLSTSDGRPSPIDQVAREQSGGVTRTTRTPDSNRSSYISNGINGIINIAKGLTEKENSAPPLPQYQLGNGHAVVPGTSSRTNELLYLLMCIPQHQYATKLLQPQISDIRSDQDFFLLIRNNYRQLRGRMRRLLSLKALRSIKFVQLEMYKSELVDIRKQDDLPPEDKKDEYRYKPVPAEIIPPVGENHMLHLINHPTHAEEDGFVLDRIPKKLKERLLVSPSRGTGLGWGIYFIEGWQVSVITIVAFAVLLAGSLAFLICWSVLEHDLQGASGVAAYIIAFLGLGIGSIQAIFELT